MTRQKPIILLIEDNPDDELLMRRALSQNKVRAELIVAHDGEEALEYLFASGPRRIPLPDLILLDLKLPKMSGLELLRYLRAQHTTEHIPIVILTTSSEERDILESYRLGGNSYIHKPVDFAEFSRVVRHLGLYWLELNHPLTMKGAQ
jgi:DNA-binding response OmpR family regulator